VPVTDGQDGVVSETNDTLRHLPARAARLQRRSLCFGRCAGLACPGSTSVGDAASRRDGAYHDRLHSAVVALPARCLTGSFVCNGCSHGPSGTVVPTGTVAEIRFDGKTHFSRDFALCKSRAQCEASLCSFGTCTRAQDTLDAAFEAFDAHLRGIPGDPDAFTRRPGTFSCQIHYPTRELRYILGTCTTALGFLGPHSAEVNLGERWRPREIEHGRWVRLPARMHRWRLLVTDDGWRVAIGSSGDPAPQLPKGSHR